MIMDDHRAPGGRSSSLYVNAGSLFSGSGPENGGGGGKKIFGSFPQVAHLIWHPVRTTELIKPAVVSISFVGPSRTERLSYDAP